MRSFDVVALVTLGLAGLAGCGSATPAPAAPAQETAVVNLEAHAPDAAKPKAEESGKSRYAIKGPTDNPDPHVARAAALRDAAEFGRVGVLGGIDVAELDALVSGVLGGAPGGVIGGVPGGVSGGLGGLGLRGVGAGGGGTGIGIGSIGTIGHGSGIGSGSGSGYGSSSASNPVAGDSVSASSTGVVELGDALTLGVSPEAGARVLRDRMALLRNCYSNRQPGNPGLSGSIALRLVVGRDGRVAHARDLASDVADASLVQCVVKELRDVYVGVPAEGHFGVIETVVRFRPPIKK